MTYRVTFECGMSSLVDDVAYRHLLRQALRREHETTKVRGGYVVTLPSGRLVAMLGER